MRFKKLSYAKYYAGTLFNNWTVKKESYAQHGEDNLIELLLPSGVFSFIDIGANDGVLFSNTYKFAKMGASGLCIEPSKSSFRKLILNHLFHPKVKCVNSAISDQNNFLFLQEEGYEKTLSRVGKEATKDSIKVKAQTFDNLISENPSFKNIDLLSIDVEGHEKNIFWKIKDKNFKANIIVVETDKSNFDEIYYLEFFNMYYPCFTNELNTFFVNKEFKIPHIEKLPKGFKKIK